jgi:hypothetical protein
MKNRGTKPWKTIDRLLVLAALAPDAQRKRELERIMRRFGLTPRLVRYRFEELKFRQVEARHGHAAIEAWQQQMILLANTLGSDLRLRKRISDTADARRAELGKRRSRSVTIRAAARMLDVHPSFLRSAIFDLELIQLDTEGRIPLAELRRFYLTEGRSLLIRHNYMRIHRGLKP